MKLKITNRYVEHDRAFVQQSGDVPQAPDLGSEVLVLQGLVVHVHQLPPVTDPGLGFLGAVPGMLLAVHLDVAVGRHVTAKLNAVIT